MFVQDNGDGTYSVVKDGQILYTDADQHKAEQWLNEHSGTTTTSGVSLEAMRRGLQLAGYPGPWDDNSVISAYNRTKNGGNKTSGGSLTDRFDDLFRSLTESNQARLDEEKRQFDKKYELELKKLESDTSLSKEEIAVKREALAAQREQFIKGLEEQSRQFGLTLDQSKKKLYAEVGTNLLSIASTLHGPENWQQYLDYTSGAKGLLGALRGDQPVAEFAQPGGYSKAYDINSLLADLGLKLPTTTQPTQTPPTGTPPTGTPPTGQPTGPSTTGDGLPRIIDPEFMIPWSPTTTPKDIPLPDTSTINPRSGNLGNIDLSKVPTTLPPTENLLAQGGAGINQGGSDVNNLISTLLGQNMPPSMSNPNNLTTGPQGYSNPALTRGTGRANQIISDLMGPGNISNTGQPVSPGNREIGGPPMGPNKDFPLPDTSTLRGPVVAPENWRTGGPTMIKRQGPQVPRNVTIESPEGAVRTPPVQQQDTRMPLPYQINPMVWDSLSDAAKQFIFGQVEHGNTPTGVWTAADYLRQLNAARPKGTAARQTNFLYRNPSSLF